MYLPPGQSRVIVIFDTVNCARYIMWWYIVQKNLKLLS
jgi:hypothetical protein